MFSPADAHIAVCDPERLLGPEAVIRVADCARVIVKALRKGEHHALLLQACLKDNARAAKPGGWPAVALPADLKLQLAVRTTVYHWLQALQQLPWRGKPDRQICATHWQEWLQADAQRASVQSPGPAPTVGAFDASASGHALAPHKVPLANLPFNSAPESSIRKSVALPAARGATEPTQCPLCADQFYTSGAMLKHLALHTAHAAAPGEDKRPPPTSPVSVARPIRPAAPLQGARECGDPGKGRGGGRRGPGGWRCSLPGVHLRVTGLPGGPPGGRLPTPHVPAPPGDLAAPADPAVTPGGRGKRRPLALLLEPVQRPRLAGPVSPGHTTTTPGRAACTDKEYLITGMLPQEGGFAIMLEETGIAMLPQEMHVAAALWDKGYTPFFSNPLAETGATSTSRGVGLLTAVSSKYVAEHKVLSITKLVSGKAAAQKIRTDKGGLTLINVHGPQAGCSPWSGRAAFWTDMYAMYDMYATARSLGGRHPVVIAGDTKVHIDTTTNPSTEHFCAGWEACGFKRATEGGMEDMTPTLHPSRHRVDTFLVNELLLPWSLGESVCARGMARPQVIWLDRLPVLLELPGLLDTAGHATVPGP